MALHYFGLWRETPTLLRLLSKPIGSRRPTCRALLLIATVFFSPMHAWSCAVDEPSLSLLVADTRYQVSGPFGVQELERQHMVEIRKNGAVLPFGYANGRWEKLKGRMQPGDALYFLVQSELRFYMEGHALVRDGCIIGFLLGAVS